MFHRQAIVTVCGKRDKHGVISDKQGYQRLNLVEKRVIPDYWQYGARILHLQMVTVCGKRNERGCRHFWKDWDDEGLADFELGRNTFSNLIFWVALGLLRCAYNGRFDFDWWWGDFGERYFCNYWGRDGVAYLAFRHCSCAFWLLLGVLWLWRCTCDGRFSDWWRFDNRTSIAATNTAFWVHLQDEISELLVVVTFIISKKLVLFLRRISQGILDAILLQKAIVCEAKACQTYLVGRSWRENVERKYAKRVPTARSRIGSTKVNGEGKCTNGPWRTGTGHAEDRRRILGKCDEVHRNALERAGEAEKANIHWSTLGGMRKAREQRRYRRAKRGKVAHRKAELGESGMRAIVRC
ncbi:hypothetical protein DFJ58DRAFT_848215 [Suillus subalutaceus]|uniref:uncharacterized protein n=1 Tax=Suillus subalutaceus TaxID=48586 RepID=UPI001B88604B|nr:uncharacterized protein DFJ58DRAFT_848215 [Suillus subalutaceus]KAG1831443.1 hypothetical protein DFJ58DRAFT_848215 [Suillus subalutaceus]